MADKQGVAVILFFVPKRRNPLSSAIKLIAPDTWKHGAKGVGHRF